MIKLSVDEGQAFDYLSILQVKADMDPTNSKKTVQYYECGDQIADQISDEKFAKIYESQEYKDLYNANLQTFKLVDLAKRDQVTASEVDKANYQRYIHKVKLQNKFFNTSITEIKVGYEAYENPNK